MSQRVLVTGATSPVGRELVRLLRTSETDVRAGTRRPDRAAELFGEGVEVAELDYSDAATFDAAVEWADRLFLLPPPFQTGAHDTLAPLLDWAVQAGTSHVVTMSAMGMEVRDDLAMRKLERHVQSLGVHWTILRPNLLMQNFVDILGERIRRTGTFRLPVDDARVSFVDGRDVAAVAALALTGDDHLQGAYTLTGPETLTHTEVAGTLSEVVGKPITFESTSDEEFLRWLTGANWTDEAAGVVIAMYQSLRAGVRSLVTQDVPDLLDRPAVSFRQFATEHAELWR